MMAETIAAATCRVAPPWTVPCMIAIANSSIEPKRDIAELNETMFVQIRVACAVGASFSGNPPC